MKRTAVNPWAWSLRLAYNQAELVEAPQRVLVSAGHAAADMTLSDVIHPTLYTTDVDALLGDYRVLAERLGAARVTPRPPCSA